MRRTVLIIALASLVLGACASDEPAPGEEPSAAAACLPDTPDCEDTVVSDPDLLPVEPRRGVSVADALSQDIDGAFEVRGFFFADAAGSRVCELLLESFPPQCGGASLPVGDFDVDLVLNSEAGVSWTDAVVSLEGEIIGGIFQPLR
jgi:hypothetical protein